MIEIGSICRVNGDGSDLFLAKKYSEQQEHLILTERIYDGSTEWHNIKNVKIVPDWELREILRKAERTKKKIANFLGY